MGLLVDGVWQEDVSRTTNGRFVRPNTAFHNWVTPTAARARPAKADFPPKPAAIISMSRSPARGRTARSSSAELKELENVISVSLAEPLYGKTAGSSARERRHARQRQRQEDARRNLSAGRSEIYRPGQRAGAVGQEAAHHRQQRVAGNHPHAQFGVRGIHQRAHRLLSGRCAARSTASTTSSMRTSTTASIAPASPPARPPTKKRRAACSRRSTSSKSGCRASAISSASRLPRRTGGCSPR